MYSAKRVALIGAIFIVGCTSLNKTALLTRIPASDTTDPTFEDILPILTGPRIQTIAEALTQLRQRYPEYMSRYALMYESESLQDGDARHPRALVFGKSGQTIITFNDSPKLREHAAIETMQLDSSNNYFFRTFIYVHEKKSKDSLKALQEEDIDRSKSNENVIVSKPNIGRCTTCHGAVARPIWANYPLWPGAYGSFEDELFRAEGKTSIGQGMFYPSKKDPEREKYKLYLASREKSPRYLQLLPQKASYLEDGKGGIRTPNIRLNRIFADQMNVKLASKILAMQLPDQSIKHLLYDLNCNPESFRIEEISPNIQKSIWESDLFDVRHYLRLQSEAILKTGFPHVDLASYTYGESVLGPISINEPAWNSPGSPGRVTDRYQTVKRLFPDENDFTLKVAAVLAAQPRTYTEERNVVAFSKIGIDLADYSVNRLRAPALRDGGGPYARMSLLLIDQLAQREPGKNWQQYKSGEILSCTDLEQSL